MAQSNTKHTTIMRQHILSLIAALAAGLLAFIIMNQGTSLFLDHYLEESGYYSSHEQKYVQSLQDFIEEQDISSSDSDALTDWGRQQDDLFFQIYDGDRLVFQYFSNNSESFREAVSLEYLEWITSYPLHFSDGTYKVMVFGDYYYQWLKYMLILDFLVAFAVFLVVFLPGIRRRARYIVQLRNEIEILGSGDLNYEITVKGNDELTDLAENLDQMRQTLKHHMEEENRLTEERRTIVTRLSHDIRTPLTSMSLFAGLLKRGDYHDEAQRDHYLDRIQENADNLSNLAEELFNAATDNKQIVKCGEKVTHAPESDIISLLTDEAEALRISGFTVKEHYNADRQPVSVDRQTFTRVLDNITSNIQRYADPNEPVIFSCEEIDGTVVAAFENAKSTENATAIGSGIGLRNVQELMQKQGGSTEIEDSNERFLIRLRVSAKG